MTVWMFVYICTYRLGGIGLSINFAKVIFWRWAWREKLNWKWKDWSIWYVHVQIELLYLAAYSDLKIKIAYKTIKSNTQNFKERLRIDLNSSSTRCKYSGIQKSPPKHKDQSSLP